MATKTIIRLHREHRTWVNQLDFSQDEIHCFLEELRKLLRHEQEAYCMQCISDYILRLHASSDAIRLFKVSIAQHEHYLAKRAHLGQHLELDHMEEESGIDAFLQSFEQFKIELRAFMAETLHNHQHALA